jgi:hypothetical protein
MSSGEQNPECLEFLLGFRTPRAATGYIGDLAWVPHFERLTGSRTLRSRSTYVGSVDAWHPRKVKCCKCDGVIRQVALASIR